MPTTSAARTTTRAIPRDPSSLGPASHPGEIVLEEFLKPIELTQAAAAQKLGMSTVRLNELVRGKRGVTADTAIRLAQLFKTTPQFWMHMQANLDLKEAVARRRSMKLATHRQVASWRGGPTCGGQWRTMPHGNGSSPGIYGSRVSATYRICMA